jgi:hypothetical protein
MIGQYNIRGVNIRVDVIHCTKTTLTYMEHEIPEFARFLLKLHLLTVELFANDKSTANIVQEELVASFMSTRGICIKRMYMFVYIRTRTSVGLSVLYV